MKTTSLTATVLAIVASTSANLLPARLAPGPSAGVPWSAGSQDPPAARAQPPLNLHILVANDDGIDSPGLAALVKALDRLGDVVVCAPDGNRSGVSHSITYLSAGLTAESRTVEGATAAWAIGGTPADCVNFGLFHFGVERPFDVVVSGINAGANTGDAAHLSGTVGAAMEAALHGVPSVAVSQEARARDFTLAAEFAADFVERMAGLGFGEGVVYSINIPSDSASQIKGVEVASMGRGVLNISGYREIKAEDGTSTWRASLSRPGLPLPGTDLAAYAAGMITITPLRFDLTDHATVEALKGVEWPAVK